MSGHRHRRDLREPEPVHGDATMSLDFGRVELWRNRSGGLDLRVVMYRFFDGGIVGTMRAARVLAASPDSRRSRYLRWWERGLCVVVRAWRYVRPTIAWFVYLNGVLNIVRVVRAVM